MTGNLQYKEGNGMLLVYRSARRCMMFWSMRIPIQLRGCCLSELFGTGISSPYRFKRDILEVPFMAVAMIFYGGLPGRHSSP